MQVITGITTDLQINKGCLLNNVKYVVSSVLMALSGASVAGDLDILPSIGASYIKSDITFDETQQSQSSDTFMFTPSIDTRFTSARLNGNARVWHQYLDRDIDNSSADIPNNNTQNNFTNFSYGLNLGVIDNALMLNFNGAQNQLGRNPINQFTSDTVLDSDDLSKTSRHSAGFDLRLPNGDWATLQMNGNYAKIKSDRTFDQENQLDNNNIQLTTILGSGDEFRRMFWSVSSNYADTERTQGDNFVSHLVRGDMGFGIWEDLQFVVVGQWDENELKNREGTEGQTRRFNTYGAGFEWMENPGRRFRLTYNRTSNSDDQDDENFIGVDLNWAFTTRTRITALYQRRFFGEASNVSLTHNTRALRTNIQYAENVTTFSRLFLSEQTIGTLVCPPGEIDVSTCFVPDTLDYELDLGEQFLEINALVPEISDRVTVTKSLAGNIGYSLRRLTASLQLRRVESEQLNDSDLLTVNTKRTTDMIGLNLGYRMGTRTTINWNSTFSESEREASVDGIQDINEDVVDNSLTVNYRFTNNLSANLNLRKRDRDSDNARNSRDEERLTFSINYRFR